MDLSKLTTNNKIASGGAVLSLINIFLPWYGSGPFNANAFDAGILAWGGALLAVAAGVLVALNAMGIFEAKVGGLSTEQFAMILGGVGALLILLKLLTDNDFTKYGIFLGLIGAGAATAGALLSAKDLGAGIPNADDFKRGGGGETSTF